MLIITLYMLAGFLSVLIGGWLFTNSMEYISHRYRIGSSFVGAVLSPILTSLPELIVFLIALLFYGGVSGEDVAVGTIIGEPFVVSTIIYPIIFIVAAIGFYLRRRSDTALEVDKALIIPFIVVLLLFPTVLLPALIRSLVIRYLVAVFLVTAYLLYVHVMRSRQGLVIEDYEGLYMLRVIRGYRIEFMPFILQLVISVVLLFVGSKALVEGVIDLSKYLMLDVMGLSIIIVPTATVLPESITAVIWTWRERDTMAVAALIGEKVLYSTVYPALALVATRWLLSVEALVSVAVVEVISSAMLYHVIKGRLTWDVALIGLIGYLTYVLILLHVI
ncbi:sodium/calcium exchanger membrane region [Vulcanisaeta moutnovskia 768-28]|uniref:Sodium/calcium exchanger membrane region n=1 Tax=Vulcanisaeta moutnovskia (strain 768-28) TaxID=985053 RepID=F0QWE6_VULM7|nr:sodium:calcium antiporter [Vulcanisaeta moutnovskia]ADY00994.1 sodium/calcium exchanger membrane region [Vulcanisaeta moutnovskia 768-28]